MGGTSYNLQTRLAFDIPIPKNYFGKESGRPADAALEDSSERSSSDSDADMSEEESDNA